MRQMRARVPWIVTFLTATALLWPAMRAQVDVFPLTTRGDLLTRDASTYVRVAIGAANRVLCSDGTDPTWCQASLSAGHVTGTLPIANGGTGQTTQTPAFDALDPLTTTGDLLSHNGTNSVRVGAGTSGQFWKSNGTSGLPSTSVVPGWSAIMATGAATGFNPTDSTTYYFAIPLTVNPGTSDSGGLFTPIACTLRSARFDASILGALGSAENSTVAIRVNHTTDVIISSTLQWTASTISAVNSALSTALAAGDGLVLKLVTPAWVTNPTVTFLQAQAYCDVP